MIDTIRDETEDQVVFIDGDGKTSRILGGIFLIIIGLLILRNVLIDVPAKPAEDKIVGGIFFALCTLPGAFILLDGILFDRTITVDSKFKRIIFQKDSAIKSWDQYEFGALRNYMPNHF